MYDYETALLKKNPLSWPRQDH